MLELVTDLRMTSDEVPLPTLNLIQRRRGGGMKYAPLALPRRRLLLLALALGGLLLLSGIVQESAAGGRGEFRLGLEGVIFKPLKQPQVSLRGDNQFPALRGLGCEVGWMYRHIEVALEANTAVAENASVESPDNFTLIMVTPRVAYRFRERWTPYFGIGVGYQWALIGPFTNTFDYRGYNVHSLSLEPYAGYDCSLTRWLGFKLEGRFQALKPRRATFAQGLRGSAGLYLALGGK